MFFLFICMSIQEMVMVMPLKKNEWCNVEVSFQQYDFNNTEHELNLVEEILYVFTVKYIENAQNTHW